MKSKIFVLGTCIILGGCALPVPVQVASWAIDAFSMITTEKSVADHGISMLTHKDCALYRAITEEDSQICRDGKDDDSGVLVASGEDAPVDPSNADDKAPVQAFAAPATRPAAPVETAALAPTDTGDAVDGTVRPAAFETAAGPEATSEPREKPVGVSVDMSRFERALEPENRPYVRVDVASLRADAVASRQVAPAETAVADKPTPGFYYVIGSFRGPERARRHMENHRPLHPTVLQARMENDGRKVFRVVVGPLSGAKKKTAFNKIRKAGIRDTWAIHVTDGDWSVAARLGHPQIAAAPGVLGANDWPGLGAFMVHQASLAER